MTKLKLLCNECNCRLFKLEIINELTIYLKCAKCNKVYLKDNNIIDVSKLKFSKY